MPLSWNEIRSRAIAFSKEFEGDSEEDAEAKSFWDAFFTVFGVPRRRVAAFERPIRQPDGTAGYIDLLWKGTLLVEHKSRGRDLDRAYSQATNYFYGLKDRDLPRYVLVSDFQRFRLFDLDDSTSHEFDLKDLHKNVRHFAFIAGYETQRIEAPEEVANIKAAEQLGKLHDLLKASGYEGHPLEVLLVRLLFCLFADDTGIFDKHSFREYLEQRTNEDGSDLGMHLAQLFQILNTPADCRQRSLDEQLASFRYVNGKLFEETLPIPAFNKAMRETLLDASTLDWSAISPAIFGSLFQSIMDRDARRNLGAHYTREINILKVLRPLFLDSLQAELVDIGTSKARLLAFQTKLATVRVLDPACGCGNFLVVAYRELRKLEHEVLRRLFRKGLSTKQIDVPSLVHVDVDQFCGIEIEEFPAQVAQAALWLTDHQQNLLLSEEFGHYFVRLPLVKSPNIVHANALRIDWQQFAPAVEISYIVGNPPFVGAKLQSDDQRADVQHVFTDVRNAGLLDYVCCWYRKAAEYMQGAETTAAFVSTNSITQGEQVGVLWPDLLTRGVKIHFAHRTFEWSSEAHGKAAVHCVIIGFGLDEAVRRVIYDYEDIRAEPQIVHARNINPYLVDAPNIVLTNRSTPICPVPEIGIGNKPIDGGWYLFSTEERQVFVSREPRSSKYFRRWLGSDEFLNGWERWCLWLGDCSPSELRQMPESMKRVEAVRKFRLGIGPDKKGRMLKDGKKRPESTRELAATPTRFHVENMPSTEWLLIPEVSSERRIYIPVGFIGPETFGSNLVKIAAGVSLYHFGVVMSLMHNAWTRAVCGRLKSDYRYSVGIVYNNFPWPEPSDAQRDTIARASQSVLDARGAHPEATLADLYDPLTMPPDLLKAHQRLDRAVDAAYERRQFKTEAERVAFLFERYQLLTSPVEAKASNRRRRRATLSARPLSSRQRGGA